MVVLRLIKGIDISSAFMLVASVVNGHSRNGYFLDLLQQKDTKMDLPLCFYPVITAVFSAKCSLTGSW